MATVIEDLLERELKWRGVPFTGDPKSGRYTVQAGATELTIDLHNLARSIDNDSARLPWFVDAILHVGSSAMPEWKEARKSVVFAIEPANHAERSDLLLKISKRVGRVPVLIDQRFGTRQWITRDMVENWRISVDDMREAALKNIASALASSTLESHQIEGVTVGFFKTPLSIKSPLLLAPNLKDIVGPRIGWPLHAVVPDQEFIYVWSAEHEQFYQQVGAVVLREYSKALHPVTTELFKISDDGIQALGAFN